MELQASNKANIQPDSQERESFVKKFLVASAFLALLLFSLAACTLTGNSNASTGGNTVGLTGDNSTQSSITIKRGASMTLVNQANIVHIIANGTWHDNTAVPQAEPGAPVVNNYTISSPNQTEVIGPFNTAGTFHY